MKGSEVLFKKILVALDGSEHALKAAKVACEMAAKTEGAAIYLLTVTRQYKVTPQLKQYLMAENLMGEPKYVLDEMTESILLEAKKIAKEAGIKDVKTQVKEGKPARTIVDFANNNNMDLIVMGSRGIGEVESFLLGSVSHKVAALAKCTCVIVR